MTPILWTPPAEADLEAIDEHWWQLHQNVADRIIERIRTAAEFLRSAPRGGPSIGHGEIRKWRAGQSPYVLIYRVGLETIEILRVHHDRQDWRPE